MSPVVGRRWQAQPLAGHELLLQPSPARVHVHVAVHEQRGDRVRILSGLALRQGPAPSCQPLRMRYQLAQPTPQRARAGTAVQTQQAAPLARLAGRLRCSRPKACVRTVPASVSVGAGSTLVEACGSSSTHGSRPLSLEVRSMA